jgi:hypothetical protein
MSKENEGKPDASCMPQSHAGGLHEKAWEWFAGKRSGPRGLVPVYARDTYQNYRRPTIPALPWWSQISAWLRYHGIQVRWDIERALARLPGRHWR